MLESSFTERWRRLSTTVGVVALLACRREDVELAAPHLAPSGGNAGAMAAAEAGATQSGEGGAGPASVDSCTASVPQDLLAPRPPLGWNGYNTFGCALDEAKLKATADAMIDSGMLSAGYQYLNLDACWQLPRDSRHRRVYDPARLPGGLAGLGDYLHERGLLLGVFSPINECEGDPAGDGYEAIDADTYAAAGVDLVKLVSCASRTDAPTVTRFQRALAETGRPMVLSLGAFPFAEWMPDLAQMWRVGFNAAPRWDWIVQSIDRTTPLAAYARPGGFNDPDMLEIGNGSLTEAEQRVQFSVWAILAAPLLASNDVTSMSAATRAILTNSEVIALNQDPLALQAALIRRAGDVDVLAKPLAECGARGAVLYNRGTKAASVTLSRSDLWLAPGAASVRDLWAHADLADDLESLVITVPPHDARALSVAGNEPTSPTGKAYLSDFDWTYAVNGAGPVERDLSHGGERLGDGTPMRLRGAAYDKGLGVRAPSLIRYRLSQRCSRFLADVGIDDETDGLGTARFQVWADGVRLFDSGDVTGTSPARRIDIDVTGRRELRLFVGAGGDEAEQDHADWAGATLECL